ncbi:kinase-like domain-containing protein [Rhizophagus irregularis DAOM 181602=DAOM 197198]|nr:kinase-like domain-containing protein [Rhizophagus irregularis DAOM 181602=DAOM 197198]
MITLIWNEGPLYYDYKEVAFRKSRNITEGSLRQSDYGISQNPDTKDYFIVIENIYCKNVENECNYYNIICEMSQDPNTKDYIIVLQDRYCEEMCKFYWTSGNEIIDYLIQEMQLKIQYYKDIIFEWIPYDQFNNINRELCNDNFAPAIWKDGPLDYKKK